MSQYFWWYLKLQKVLYVFILTNFAYFENIYLYDIIGFAKSFKSKYNLCVVLINFRHVDIFILFNIFLLINLRRWNVTIFRFKQGIRYKNIK